MNKTADNTTVAHALLARLSQAGVKYFLANAGTDFPPIIEALAEPGAAERYGLQAMLIPHENVAMAMAHGYAMITGQPLAVMLHVNVGTSNAICGLTNASRTNIPLLLLAGRTPLTEHGSVARGTRSRHIHWAQEMFDQGGMLRELVKWDYELRAPEEAGMVLDRALSLALSPPMGPVYLSIPREVLAAPAAPSEAPPRARPATMAYPDPQAIQRAAELLGGAESPLIITSDVGRSTTAAGHLAELAEQFAIPVVTHVPRYMNLANDHPMHLGYEASPHLARADVVLVVDSDVPWIPSTDPTHPEARVIHLGEDPLFGRYPMRGYPSELTIAANPAAALKLLAEAMAAGNLGRADRVEARRAAVATARAEVRAGWQKVEEAAQGAVPIRPALLARHIGELVDDGAILVNEMGVPPNHAGLSRPGSYFGPSPAGGLGWGLGAALGAKLAQPDKLIVATVGDGSYFFGNPTAAHYAARVYDLPVLFVIVNNGGWGAVRRATRAMYPEGAAVRGNDIPLSRLEPALDYEAVVAAAGGHGERVDNPDDLPEALERAVHAVTVESRQALLNVIVAEG
ncbi:MAG: thiamine pyrophosphate-requiring protein [Alphaproteobacteria bacterium]|jgi:acetolactate synthase-1/2/3 large subunit|nr:thiamine pyrophosphate-requiring protein [Alphaproteobacteria bacterium]MDP6564676.1 thiamine pyrophosphate-requiring protein [Alphaproteobacteria bacterium]MDP6813554.1 thiamine pyrophosphate-requiring protein [Alphaproteobacteria bacterium]